MKQEAEMRIELIIFGLMAIVIASFAGIGEVDQTNTKISVIKERIERATTVSPQDNIIHATETVSKQKDQT